MEFDGIELELIEINWNWVRSGTEREFASSAEGLVLSGPFRLALPAAAAGGIPAG